MSATQPQPLSGPAETERDRRARLIRESEMLAEAEMEIAAGHGLRGPELEAWLQAFEGDADSLPSPR